MLRAVRRKGTVTGQGASERVQGSEGSSSTLDEVRRDLAVSLRALGSTFGNPNLRRSLIGLTAFSIREWGGYIALSVFAFDQGGTRMVGVISLVQLIPAAIIAPFGSMLGDRFYVVASGELIVSAYRREVGRHGPGGYSGEIALRRDVPRTATVTAATQTRLLSLERDEFLRAVTGHAPAREAADAVASERIRHLREANPD